MKNKKTLALFLATAMSVACLAGCAGDSAGDSVSTASSQEVQKDSSVSGQESQEETGVTFPLEEEVTFEIMIQGNGDEAKQLEKNKLWQDLYEQTNVKIELITLPVDDTMTALNGMFTAGMEGDAIIPWWISDTDLSMMAANDLLMPLNEFIDDEEIMPNFNSRVLANSPQTKGVITSPNGKIYALPRYDCLEGTYLESPIWINKKWLDQLGMDMPTTLDELKEVLIAFRDNDMNGNGKTDDEIPYHMISGDAFSHMESFLGLFGIPTKDSAMDNYIYLEDGQLIFAPTSTAYKDAIKVLNEWYEEGLIWSECFTGTPETFIAKIDNPEPLVGMYMRRSIPEKDIGDYVQLAPVAVDGYEARWYVHPGKLGVKGAFAITRSCENPEILMKWIDLFYSHENSVRILLGEEEEGRYELVDGKIHALTLTAEETETLKEESPNLYSIINGLPYSKTNEDYEERYLLSESDEMMQKSLDIYEEYLNDEIWPRPYLSKDVTSRLAELRTDIFNTVAMKRAAWVTGESDIDSEWDEYVASLEKMGVDEFVSILQSSYDVYMEGQK